jgi:regulator of protease activity HflC (stomatin/prohibitin superfamily)
MNTTKLVSLIVGAVVLIVCAIAFWPFVQIEPGEVGIVTRLGKIEKTLPNGFHPINPFLNDVTRVNIQDQKETVSAAAASKDMQMVSTTIALNYVVDPNAVAMLFAETGLGDKDGYKVKIIDPAIQEAVKASTAKYNAEELITKREIVKEDIKLLLVDRLTPYHVVTKEVSIVDFDFSDSFNISVENKVKAEQDALTQKNKLEEIKYKAQQTIETAKAEAEAQRISSQSLAAQGGKDYVQLKAIERWNGVLPSQMVPGSAVPFVSLSH